MNRRAFLLGSAASICVARAAAEPNNTRLMLVNVVSSVQNPYYASWDDGGRSFARSIGLPYDVIQHQGRIDNCLQQIKSLIDSTGGDVVLNIDLASKFDARSLVDLCRAHQIFFVTHSFGQPSVHPWDCNPYYVSHIASDHTMAGLLTANALINVTGRKGRIVALGGPLGDIPANQRKAGLDQALTTTRQCTLLDYQRADWQPTGAFEIARWWLARYREQLDGIWAANDRMALGAIEALRVYRAVGKIPVTGIDGLSDAIDSVRAGELTATVAWDAFYEGGIGLAIAYSAKERVIDPIAEPDGHREFFVSLDLVTKDNAERYSQYLTRRSNVNWRDLWARASGQPVGR
jgi:ribose transport system substrate-binding protein